MQNHIDCDLRDVVVSHRGNWATKWSVLGSCNMKSTLIGRHEALRNLTDGLKKVVNKIDDIDELRHLQDSTNDRIRELAGKILGAYSEEIITDLHVLGTIWNLSGDRSLRGTKAGVWIATSGPFEGKPAFLRELDRYVWRTVEHCITGAGTLIKHGDKYSIEHKYKCKCGKVLKIYQVPGGTSSCFRYFYLNPDLEGKSYDVGEVVLTCQSCGKCL